MPRLSRLKVKGQDSYYHIITRTVGREYLLNEEEKEKLVYIINRFSRLFFVKINTYCIMSNHWHLLIKMESGKKFSDEEILTRLKNHYGKFLSAAIQGKDIEYFRKKLSDLSSYVQMIKQTFSRWYNKLNNRSGYFWGERFKSVLIQDGVGLLNCMAYIDLNPVRAKMVQKPEQYRFSGIGARVGRLFSSGQLTFEGTQIKGFEDYYKILYPIGKTDRSFEGKEGKIEEKLEILISGEETVSKAETENSQKPDFFKTRIRYFSDGLVLGSKIFIKEAYVEFSNKIIFKKDRKAYDIGLEDSIFSIRYLKNP